MNGLHGKQKLMIGMAMIAGVFLLSAPAQAKDSPNPYLKPDQTWISISGTAVDTKPDGFTLDYGKGTIPVEMDDWDWYDESSAILEGDKVTVYGEIDDDFFEIRSIEASSVYVENLGTHFYASSADEEYDYPYDYWGSDAPIDVGKTVVRGTVTSTSGREFTINTGLREMKVDTLGMMYNPMDDKGFHQIDKGDYVSVTGDINYTFWEKKELLADSIITLIDD